jgi:hypothetical protein
MNRWYTLLERVLEDVRARGPPAASDVSLVAHLLRIVNPATGAHLTDAQLLPELGIVFVAGMETSGKTMGWTLCACVDQCACGCMRAACTLPAHSVFFLEHGSQQLDRTTQGHRTGIALALPCSTLSLFGHAPLKARTCLRSACARAYDKTRPRVCVARFCISQHPEVEARLAAELDDNGLLAKRGRPNPRMVSHDDLAKLAYLGRVIKVSMEKARVRLHAKHCRAAGGG